MLGLVILQNIVFNIDQRGISISTLVGRAWEWVQILVGWWHVRCCVWVLSIVLGFVILQNIILYNFLYWKNDLISLNSRFIR